MSRRSAVPEHQLVRKSPARAKDLETIRVRLGLANHTEAIEEAISILMLITRDNRKSFLLEEKDGRITKITL